MEEEDLAAAFHLAAYGIADDAFVVGGDGGGDGEAVGGRGVDGGHVARAHECHVEGARDGGGGEGEDVDLAEEVFEFLLVGDSEALLLIDDGEAEILVGDVAGDEAVGADDHIDGAVGEAFDGGADFGGGAEAVEEIDADRVVGEAFAEGAPVLLCEDGGGAEEGGLFAAGDALEGGADGDFGFPESDVAADEAVHGVGGFEVVLGVLDGLFLIGGFGVVEDSARTRTSSGCRAGGRGLVRARARPGCGGGGRRNRGWISRPACGFSARWRCRVC